MSEIIDGCLIVKAFVVVLDRLRRELEALGHDIGMMLDWGDLHCESEFVIDHDFDRRQRLDLVVTADADSSGRPAIVKVGWNGRHGRVVRWGAAGDAATFADFGRMARDISAEVRRSQGQTEKSMSQGAKS